MGLIYMYLLNVKTVIMTEFLDKYCGQCYNYLNNGNALKEAVYGIYN